MKLEVEMYVRTEEGKIFKTDGDLIYLSNDKKILYKLITRIPHDTINYKVVKASYNIIDILEVGDYVNDSKVVKTHCKLEYVDDDSDTGVNEVDDGLELENGWIYFEHEVETIVTKEQFEQMAYKVGE